MTGCRQRGLTLLEVLVALAVVATALAAGLKTASQSVENTAEIERRTVAQWVAANRVAELRLEGLPDPEDRPLEPDVVSMMGMNFIVSVTLSDGEAPRIETARIEVAVADRPDRSLAMVEALFALPIDLDEEGADGAITRAADMPVSQDA